MFIEWIYNDTTFHAYHRIHSDGSVGVKDTVTPKDLEHLFHVIEGKDGTVAWQSMMEHTTPNMTYQAWRYEPMVNSLY